MRWSVFLLAGLGSLALGARAEVSIQPAGDRLSLQARNAPVSEVLDRLARQTGMKVVYEGAPPRQTVTLSLESRTPAEAVLAVLDGLGLNFAVLLDERGGRVVTLLMAGSAPAVASAAPAAAQPTFNRAPTPPPQPPPDEIPEEEPIEAQPDTQAEVAAPAQGPPTPNPTGGPGLPVNPQPIGSGFSPFGSSPFVSPGGGQPQGPMQPNAVSVQPQPPAPGEEGEKPPPE